jgi:hypothetical protein
MIRWGSISDFFGLIGNYRAMVTPIRTANIDSISELTEIADILAAGLMRLKVRKSNPISTESGERLLHFTPDQSGDAATCSLKVDG